MIDVASLVAKKNVAPRPGQSAYEAFGAKPPVEASEDLARVAALPRRAPVRPTDVRGEALVEFVTGQYAITRTTPCRCAVLGRECITRLRLTQAWALHEIATTGGLLGPIGVGHGKTMLDLLAPLALPGAKLVILLVPPGLVSQLVAEYDLVGQHFRMPSITVAGQSTANIVPGAPVLHVLPYSRLSREGATAYLESMKPDAIIADEVHKLRHADTATTSRVLRYFAKNPSTRFCGWSGSITDSSIKDYYHLSALALRERSPLPVEPKVAEDWARALDPGDNPAPAGALIELCQPGEHVQDAFHRRLVETQGVVATTEPAVPAKLVIDERKAPPLPATVRGALNELRAAWMRPDGEELVDAIAVARCAWQLACGFYYRWVFPRGESAGAILEWLDARKEWHREMREKLRARSPHLDSPLLLARAAGRAWGDWKRASPAQIRAELAAELDDDGSPLYEGDQLDAEVAARLEYDGKLPEWKATTWPRWRAAKGTVRPSTEAVRLDPFLAEDAAAWAREHRGIVWFAHRAFGDWVAEVGKLPIYGGGPQGGGLLDEGGRIREKGDRSIVLSIKAHGTGRDGLQFLFAEQLVANPPSSGSEWEQLLGRLHRVGQKAPRVTSWFYRHTPELRAHVDKAVSRAIYVQRTIGQAQKLQMGWRPGSDEGAGTF